MARLLRHLGWGASSTLKTASTPIAAAARSLGTQFLRKLYTAQQSTKLFTSVSTIMGLSLPKVFPLGRTTRRALGSRTTTPVTINHVRCAKTSPGSSYDHFRDAARTSTLVTVFASSQIKRTKRPPKIPPRRRMLNSPAPCFGGLTDLEVSILKHLSQKETALPEGTLVVAVSFFLFFFSEVGV
jgi:hypothetical protein